MKIYRPDGGGGLPQKKQIRRIDSIVVPRSGPPPTDYMKWITIALFVGAILWCYVGYNKSVAVEKEFKSFLAANPPTSPDTPQEEWLNAKPERTHLILSYLANPFRDRIAIEYMRSGSISSIWFTARKTGEGQWQIEKRPQDAPPLQIFN